MHYKFTFSDGSEAIAHYGTKGMKWGVWNDETKARYNGGTSKEAKKYQKGYDKYQKAKARTEGAADRYVSNPTRMNTFRMERAATKETKQNSEAFQDWAKNYRRSYMLGGAVGNIAYSKASKTQQERLALTSAHLNETLSTRIDDANAKRAKITGQKAIKKTLQQSATYKTSANTAYEKAASYERGFAEKEHKKGQQALAKAQQYRARGDENMARAYETLHAGRAARRDERLDRANNIRKVKSTRVEYR